MLEKTFVNACLQLATGFVDNLKLFIASSLAGYQQGISAAELLSELAAVKITTANRPLAIEESDLRAAWVGIVYLTAREVEEDIVNASAWAVPEAIRQHYGPLVTATVRAHYGGWTIKNVETIEILKSANMEPSTELEKAVLSQCIRVVFLTLQVLDEITLAKGDAVPRPNIPGTK